MLYGTFSKSHTPVEAATATIPPPMTLSDSTGRISLSYRARNREVSEFWRKLKRFGPNFGRTSILAISRVLYVSWSVSGR